MIEEEFHLRTRQFGGDNMHGSGKVRRKASKYGVALIGFMPLLLLISRFLLPQRLVDNRSGVGIIDQVYFWGLSLPSSFEKSQFPARFFHAIYMVLPFMPDSLGVWDGLVLGVGIVLMVFMLAYYADRYRPAGAQCIVLFVLVALAGIFIFQVGKDFIQCLIFCLAFLVCISRLPMRARLALIFVIFAAEGTFWRTYYFIMAMFVPLVYMILVRLAGRCSAGGLTWKQVVGVAALTFMAMIAFAYILHAASPANYDQIVYQHSQDREGFTATDAASGISSVIPLSRGSSVLAFVANWAINVFRLLLPVELLAKSLRYVPFVIYQLIVTFCLARTLLQLRDNSDATLVVAMLLAFVVTSASFEPDFGSWVRHETATLPFIIELLGLSNLGAKRRFLSEETHS